MLLFFFSILLLIFIFLFFFNDTATTEIYTLSLHDALPISELKVVRSRSHCHRLRMFSTVEGRSEEHTSELQSRQYLVCRLLLEKKKKKKKIRRQVCSMHQLECNKEEHTHDKQ